MQKLLNQFPQYLVEKWHMGHGRYRQISVTIQLKLRLALGQGYSLAGDNMGECVLLGIRIIVTIM